MPGNMKIQTTQGSFSAKSSKCLPNITFSTSFSKSFFQKNCRVPYLRYIKFSFLTTFMFSHPLSPPEKSTQARSLCPKHPNSSARPCFDGNHCEYTQECSEMFGRPGIWSLMVAFHPMLPLPSSSAVPVCSLHL